MRRVAQGELRMKTRYWIVALLLATGTVYAEDAKQKDDKAEHKDDAKPKKDDTKKEEAPPKEAGAASAEVKAGTGVENHEIVGEAATFPAGATVWVWSRVTNGQGTIKHVWKRDGQDVWTGTLPVSSARWSTMTRRTIGSKGSWTVDVQTDAGASLGTVSFTIE
jgi:hypothetical protein